MDLKQRKRILNMPKFDGGSNDYSYLDRKVGLNPSQSSIAQDLVQMVGLNAPKGFEAPGGLLKKPGMSGALDKSKLSSGIGKGLGAASAALGIAQGMMSSLNVKSQNQLQQEAGTTNQTIMGINYDQQNQVDGSQDLKEQDSKGLTNTASSALSGAQAGLAVGGPLGAAIGGVIGLGSGLFGWLGGRSKLRKRIRNAKVQASQTAQLQRSQAMSKGLQNQYYLDYGDTSTQTLYV